MDTPNNIPHNGKRKQHPSWRWFWLTFLVVCAHRVHGEIYRVPNAAGWSVLDRLEGHPRFYSRRVIGCEVDGIAMDAWTYFIQGELGRFAHLPPVREYSRNLEFA